MINRRDRKRQQIMMKKREDRFGMKLFVLPEERISQLFDECIGLYYAGRDLKESPDLADNICGFSYIAKAEAWIQIFTELGLGDQFIEYMERVL